MDIETIVKNQNVWARMYQEQQRRERKEYNLKHIHFCRKWRENQKEIKRKNSLKSGEILLPKN